MRIGFAATALGILLAAAAANAAATPRAVLEAYVEAVAEGRIDDARGLWHADYLAESAAPGIRYVDVAAPWDLASPLWSALPELAAGRLTCTTRTAAAGSDTGFAVLVLTVASGADSVEHRYAAVQADGEWRLAGMVWAGGRRWPSVETEYFRVHHEGAAPSAAACRALDAFVTDSAGALGLSAADLDRLGRLKLPYYLCNEATIERLTGHSTRGMADLAGSAVISTHFPHFHETAHLLINFALGETPLYTLPLLQEGAACLLGGRWGRAPATILYTGYVNTSFGMVDPAALLTLAGFRRAPGGADAAYAAAAVFCDAVHRACGWPALWDLYRGLSGDDATVERLAPGQVLAATAAACGRPDDLPYARLFLDDSRAAPYRRCGIEPGGGPDPAPAPVTVAGDAGDATIVDDDGRIVFTVAADAWPVYLLSAAGEAAAAGSLFAEHLPGVAYRGERYGVRCDPDNVSVYDFVRNELVATWVAGFTDEPGACDTAAGGLSFTVTAPVIAGGAGAFATGRLVLP